MPRKPRRRIRAAAAPAGPFRVAAATAAVIAAADGDGKKLATFTGTAYTGQPMRPEGWWQDVVIDLAGVRVPSQQRPALRQHDHQQIVGHTETVTVTTGATGAIGVAGVFSGQKEHVDKVVEPARNGFPWQLSVGANPVRTEYLEAGEETEVNGRAVTGPLVISRETELGEVSFVPLGADGDTSATVSASRGKGTMFAKAALKLARTQGVKAAQEYTDAAIDEMTDAEARAALKKCMKDSAEASAAGGDDDEDDTDTDADATAKAAKAAALVRAEVAKALRAAQAEAGAEVRRQSEIRARLVKYAANGLEVEIEADGGRKKVNLVEHAIAAGWTPDTAELHALRSARPTVVVAGGLGYSTSTPEANEAVIEAAVLHALRHQFQLDSDSFYTEPTPDGRGTIRRVPAHVEADARRDFRARYTDQVQQAAHTLFKGRITLKQIFSIAFSRWGYGRQLDLTGEQGVRDAMRAWDYYEGPAGGIRAEGASNLSVSNMLANVQNKFSLQGYLWTEQAWRKIAGVKSVTDFKATKSINLLGDVMYKQLGPTGELENFAIGDQAFSNQAAPYGRIGTIPWTHIVNDDLGMLGTVPLKLGQGAGLALNDAIWTVWKNMAAGTVNGDDGNAFWRTTSVVTAAAKKAGTAYMPNKLTGAGSAFGDAGLKAAMAAFWNQIDPNGNPLGFDALTPVLLHGPTLWRDVTAQAQAPTIVYGGGTAANAPNANVWAGKFEPVMSRYVENASYGNTTTGWWLLFAAAVIATIEAVFLNGADTPAVLTAGPDYQFDRLGISMRGTMPFGVNQQNFRGGIYNVGA